MVEITQPSPDSFLSDSDKHRGTRLPVSVDDDLCLETGIDLGDGTHVVFNPGSQHSSYVYSISQHYPDEWFGGRFVLCPLLSKLYGIGPRLRKSSPRRNGICVYLNSRAVVSFKCRALGLSSGERSRSASIPSFVKTRGRDSVLRFLEGFQYADGSFVCGKSPCVRVTTSSWKLAREIDATADELSVSHSMSRDHPTTGFSLRTTGEGIRQWVRLIPLLNPVHVSKFLVWNTLSDCPPRLFLRQCVSLLLGDVSPTALLKRQSIEDYKKHFLESVDLLTLFVLRNDSLNGDGLVKESVARSGEAAMKSVKRLRRDGFLRISLSGKQSSYSLRSKGIEVIERFEEAWEMIRHENPRIFPLKSYERLSVPPVIAEEPPRLAN
jgi:hypothetical protein